MKAIIYQAYGSPDNLKRVDIEKPKPKGNEVLIQVQATGLNAADWRLLRANPFFVRFFAGLLRPKNHILGSDVAGTVVAVGGEVTALAVGDQVFGDLSGEGLGGLAEYVTAPADLLAPIPKQLDFVQTAALPMASVTALTGLRDVGEIQAGDKVLIHGASGGVGTFAVQIAKALGGDVTAVCSTAKTSLAKSLGADHVIDYTQEDFSKNGVKYDLILAVNGDRRVADYIGSLTPTGRYVVAGGTMRQLFEALLLGRFKVRGSQQSVRDYTAKPNQADLLTIKAMVEAGQISPVIDRCYPLEETTDAFHYLEAGSAKGKIVITI